MIEMASAITVICCGVAIVMMAVRMMMDKNKEDK